MIDYLLEFRGLLMKMPKLALPMSKCENSDYNVFIYRSKNCYLCRGSSYLKNCFHCDIGTNGKNSSDCTHCNDFEWCYSCVDSKNIYNCNFCSDCRDCHDCFFSTDLLSCENCFGCVGLRHAKFHIFNKPYSEKEYHEQVAKLLKKQQREIEETVEQIAKSMPRIGVRGTNNENCTGDHLNNCKNCLWSFSAVESEDCIYVYDEIFRDRDCVDITHVHNSELCYDCVSVDAAYNCNFCFWLEHSRDCEFGYNLIRCENCFMSTYLRGKKFYILNEPYSETDYLKKTSEIKSWLREKNLYGQNLIYLALKGTPEINQYL